MKIPLFPRKKKESLPKPKKKSRQKPLTANEARHEREDAYRRRLRNVDKRRGYDR